MRKILLCTIGLCTLPAAASTSISLTFASDYLFNGISQTQEKPAFQGSFDWSDQTGWYAGVWGSNVDFNDDTNIEFDGYVGYVTAMNEQISLDVGLAQYTYHGGDNSSNANFAEVYAKFNFGETNLNFWYSWDYFGTGAGHSIVMLTHSFPVNEALSIELGVDYSVSLDTKKYEWQDNDNDYLHWRLTANYTVHDWHLSLGFEDTDLKNTGDATAIATIGRSFSL